MSLRIYQKKRNFKQTPEPKGKVIQSRGKKKFFIQKHAASHLHYDFRLELNGVLKSWAVPKGPSLDPKVRRLAMHVEDHPIEYGTFEGIIPPHQYGAGTVMLWDRGYWESEDKNPYQAYVQGNMTFTLNAEKLQGRWKLIRIKSDNKSWLLMKLKDAYAREEQLFNVTLEEPNSVLTQQTLDEITNHYQNIWHSDTGLEKVRSVARENAGSSLKKKKSSTKFAKKMAPKKKVPFAKTPKITINLPHSRYPQQIWPSLATLVDEPPSGKDWLHEIKLDGYRMITFKQQHQIKIITRNQNDWTNKFGDVVAEISRIFNKNAIVDGEVVVLDENQHSNFQLLQNSIKDNQGRPFIYYVFDLLYYDQFNLTGLPLLKRKQILKKIVAANPSDVVRYNDHIIGSGKEIFAKTCELGLEGIVSKNINSDYVQKRTREWLKVKCLKRQEFIIGGYTKPQGKRQHFGSLLLGTFNKRKELIYNGNVGTGFTEKSLQDIYKLLTKYKTDKMPFLHKPPGSMHVSWLKPVLMAEVEFSAWTNDGYIRHSSFKGLRSDKSPASIVKEEAEIIENIAPAKNEKKLNYHLTNPHKILYPEDHISKSELANYYDSIADWILPYLVNRALTIVRCPNGYQSECFYQKHMNKSTPSTLYGVTIKEKDSKEKYIYLKDHAGLLALAQMGALEIHPWGSRIETLEYPDILVFDLDPAPDVKWQAVVRGAFAVKNLLAKIKLKSFVRTTGGKGLHVVVPIKAEYDWQEIKTFTRIVADYLVKQNPSAYIDQMTKAKRKGKVFVDYLRNQRGATAIASYATRARKHAPVATPLDWDELTDDFYDTFFTLKTLPQRFKQLKKDPWKNFFKIKQSLNLDKLK